MKINIETQLICVDKKYIRGVPLYIINLIKALENRRNNEYFYSFFDYNKERGNRGYIDTYIGDYIKKDSIRECNTLNYKKVIEGMNNLDSSLYDEKSYEEYIEESPDICHFPSVACFPLNVHCKMAITVPDIMPVIPSFSKYWTDYHVSTFKNSLNYVRNHENINLIAISEHTKKDLMEYADIEANRIYVTPLGIDTSAIFPDNSTKARKDLGIEGSYILYLGAIDYRKGIDCIIKAFDIVKEKIRDLKLVLAGNTEQIYKEHFSECLSESKNIDDIIITGYVSEEYKRELISNAEIFLFPSEYEGFGLPILEAMACHTPVVTTAVSSIPEVGGDAVLYSEVNKEESLAEQVINILESNDLKNKLILKGIERLKEFSWDKTAESTENVYKMIKNS